MGAAGGNPMWATLRSLLRQWWLYLVLVGLVLAAAAVGAELTWFFK
jgi:hypothetical protein